MDKDTVEKAQEIASLTGGKLSPILNRLLEMWIKNPAILFEEAD